MKIGNWHIYWLPISRIYWLPVRIETVVPGHYIYFWMKWMAMKPWPPGPFQKGGSFQ